MIIANKEREEWKEKNTRLGTAIIKERKRKIKRIIDRSSQFKGNTRLGTAIMKNNRGKKEGIIDTSSQVKQMSKGKTWQTKPLPDRISHIN